MCQNHRSWGWVIVLLAGTSAFLCSPSALLAQERWLERVVVEGHEAQGVAIASTTSDFPPTTFVIQPSETSHPRCLNLADRPSRFRVVYRCVDGFNVVPNCQIQINHSVAPDSGGHSHNGDRPQGEFVPSSGTTGSTGCCFDSVYTAPEAAGVTQVSAVGTDPAGNLYFDAFTLGVLYWDETQLGVQVRLVSLPPGENYLQIGERDEHPANHFGTPAFNAALVTLADAYAARFPGQTLQYNDMSLVGGGVFDLNFNWGPPRHCLHREGRNMDLRTVGPMPENPAIPEANRPELRRIARWEVGLRVQEETVPPHWHLTLAGGP